MRRRKQRLHDHCPWCDVLEEHLVHILTCPHPDVRSLTDNLLVELEVWFTKKDTYPELIPILIASIRSWLTDPYGEEPTFMWPTVLISEAILAQQQLGWYAFLMGCIAKPIVSLQNSYYITTHSKKKGTTWATKLIIKCWNVVFQLWTHRNSVLHETQALVSLSGLSSLRLAITAEFTLGRSSYTEFILATSDIPGKPYFNKIQINLNNGSLSSELAVNQWTTAKSTSSQQMLLCATGLASRQSTRKHISFLSL